MAAPSPFVQVQGQGTVTADQYNTLVQGGLFVANARNFVGIQGITIYLWGYTSADDGGQGPFYWNASGTGPDDGGVTNIVVSGATTGCWTRLSVSLAGNQTITGNLTVNQNFTVTGNSTLTGNVTIGGTISGELIAYNNQSGTTYTLLATDTGKTITLTNASAITVTFPNNLSIGFNCECIQGGAGQVSFSAASGATLQNRSSQTKIAGQYGAIRLEIVSNSGGTSAIYNLAGDTSS